MRVASGSASRREGQQPDPWQAVMPGFRSVRFQRVDPAHNAYRAYLILWQPTLFDQGAVVRQFGRLGQDPRTVFTAFPSLDAAWPLIRALVRARLRHGYRIVALEAESPVL